jgi:hypothetical protein
MSKTAFAFISIIRLIAAFIILLFIWNPELLIFKYRYPLPDPTLTTYYQVDDDALLSIIIFGFPLTLLFILLSILFIFLLKKVSLRQSVLARISLLLAGIGLSIWINSLIAIIKLCNALVSCDSLIIGKSVGCYMP